MYSIRPCKPALLALLMSAGLAALWPAQPAQADACAINWNTDSSGNFNVAGNWDQNRVPTGADKACINRPVGNPEVTIPAGYTATLAALTNRDGLLRIDGALVITGSDSILANLTVIDRCSGLLQVDAGGGLALEGDAADVTWSNYCPTATLVVNGALNKTGGGISTFAATSIYVQGGTLSATEGTLGMGNGSLVSATLNAGISGTLSIGGGVYMSGTLTGSGAGRVDVDGHLVATGTQAILNFPNGLLRWTGGYIDARYAPITNTGFIRRLSVGANLCGDVRNSGTLDVEAPLAFDLQTATLTNLASGTINLRGDTGDLSWQNGCYDTWPTSQGVGILRNYGMLNKTDGGNSSIVNVQVKTVGGSVHVVSGTLSPANQPHLFENANIVIDAGATINADAAGGGAFSVLAMSGTVTGTGAGQLVLAQRLKAVGNGARLNFAPGWLTFGPNGAEFDGYTAPITNVNQIDLPFNTNVTVCGVFDNQAAVNIRGIWNQDVRRTRLNNAPNGVINLIHDGGVSSAGIFNWGNCAASISENDGARVVNRGRIVKTGSGVSRITNSNLDVIGGSVEVLSGTLGGDGLSNFSSFYQNASLTVAPSATLAHCYPARVDGSLTASGGGLVRVAELRGYGAGGDVDMPPDMLVMQSGACAGYTSIGINGVDAPLNIRGAIQNESSGDLNVYGSVSASPGAQFRMTNQRSLVIYSGALFRAVGTPAAPVLFQGAVAVPAIGVWRDIRVLFGGTAELEDCVIRDGSNPGVNAAIYNPGGILRIERCRLDGPGIGLYSIGDTQLRGNRFARGTDGNQLGNGSVNPLDARLNWWGHPSGPYHATLNPSGLGITVTGNVLFDPWLESVADDLADLATTSVLASSARADLGASVTVTYVVANAGVTVTNGVAWTDTLVLSRDGEFDAGDEVLAQLPHTGALAPGQKYTVTTTITLPRRANGIQRLVVKTDSKRNVLDGNRANNSKFYTLFISAPVLSVGETRNAPLQSADDLLVYALAASGSAEVQLRVTSDAYLVGRLTPPGDIPDFVANQPTERFTLLWQGSAETMDGLELRVAANAHSFPAFPMNVHLSLQALSVMTVTGISPNNMSTLEDPKWRPQGSIGSLRAPSAANAISLSDARAFEVRGAHFTAQSQVWIVDPQNTQHAISTTFVSSQLLVADMFNFDRLGLPISSAFSPTALDVLVTDGPATARVPKGILVGREYGPEEESDQVRVWVDTASYVRVGSPLNPPEIKVVVNYENTALRPIRAPLINLHGSNTSLRLSGSSAYAGENLLMLALGGTPGRIGTLYPGEGGQIIVFARPTTVAGHFINNFTASVGDVAALNAITQVTSLKPSQLPQGVWDAVLTQLNTMGGNTGHWVTDAAEYLDAIGQRTHDVKRLYTFAINRAGAFGAIAKSNTDSSFGLGGSESLVARVITITHDAVTVDMLGQPRTFSRKGLQFVEPATQAVAQAGGGLAATIRESTGLAYQFGSNGLLASVGVANGISMTRSYDGAGRVTRETFAGGAALTYTYDAQSHVISVDGNSGNLSRHLYDGAGRMISETRDGITTLWSYWDDPSPLRNNALKRATLANETQVDYTYDASGRVATRAIAGGDTLQFAYGIGEHVTTTYATGGVVETWADDRGNIARVKDRAGLVARMNYDESGNLTSSVDPDGKRAYWARDEQGNTVSRIDELGAIVQFGIDGRSSRMLYAGDANGNTTRRSWDADGRLKSTGLADGASNLNEYGPTGSLSRTIDYEGALISYGWDVTGALTSMSLPGGAQVNFAYDISGTVRSIQKGADAITMSRDARGAITRVEYASGRSITYTRDASSRIQRVQDQTGFAVQYVYDGQGKLTSIQDQGNQPIETYVYDAFGRTTSVVRANGASTHYIFNAIGRMTRMENRDAANQVISFFENAYDALNRAVTITSTEGVAQYAYDLAGQLTRAAMPDGRILTYEYDVAGNRIRMTENASPTSYTANGLNQITGAGVWTYSYDNNGNLIGKSNGLQTWTLTYDVFQRLISQTTPGDVWSYEYDLLGFQSAVVHNGLRTELLHDPVGKLLFAEYDGAGGLLAHYASGFGISSRVSPTGSHSFYAFDPAGTVVNLTGSAGNVLNTYRYDPFGQVVTQSETLATPLRWLGQQGVLDHRDGLLNIGARKYDASLGRFAQRDPLEMPGENVYLYAHNDPLNKKDIDGFWEISTNPDTGWQTSNDELGILGGSIKDAATSILNARIRTAADAAARYTDAAAGVFKNARLVEKDIELSTRGLAAVASQWSGMADMAKGKLSALTAIGDSKAMKGLGILGNAVTVGDNLITLNDYRNGKATGLELLNKTGLTAAAVASKFPPFKLLMAAPYLDYASKKGLAWFYDGRFDKADNDVFGDPARAAAVRDQLRPTAPSKSTEQITPDDPNEIEGPSGVGAQRWLPASFDGWLDYTIRFENKPAASAAAQQVFVSSQLDPDLDWSTFEFGDVGLAYTRYAMPWTANLDTRLDARPSVSLYVGISATLNAATGELRWALTSIDPDSLAPTTDVLAGFLPPNDATSRGEGFVSYRVKAKPMLSTGAQITALAQIVFDSNDPIATNSFTNTLDARGPSVDVGQLTTTTIGTQITVTWSGQDDAPISGTLRKLVAGSGVGSYDVFVVSDLFSMTRILSETTQTALTFNGVISHTYGFVIMASDAVGQPGEWPSEVQTQTTLVLTNPKNHKAMLPIVRR